MNPIIDLTENMNMEELKSEKEIKAAELTLTPEQAAQELEYAKACEEAYEQYSSLRGLYEQCLAQEMDPHRRELLEACLEELNEENK